MAWATRPQSDETLVYLTLPYTLAYPYKLQCHHHPTPSSIVRAGEAAGEGDGKTKTSRDRDACNERSNNARNAMNTYRPHPPLIRHMYTLTNQYDRRSMHYMYSSMVGRLHR